LKLARDTTRRTCLLCVAAEAVAHAVCLTVRNVAALLSQPHQVVVQHAGDLATLSIPDKVRALVLGVALVVARLAAPCVAHRRRQQGVHLRVHVVTAAGGTRDTRKRKSSAARVRDDGRTLWWRSHEHGRVEVRQLVERPPERCSLIGAGFGRTTNASMSLPRAPWHGRRTQSESDGGRRSNQQVAVRAQPT
jgi:hypothetical protein